MNARRIFLVFLLAAIAPATVWAVTAEPVGIGGATGATDNAILRADGTGGTTPQSSAVTIADTISTITFPAAGMILAGDGAAAPTAGTPGIAFSGATGVGFRRNSTTGTCSVLPCAIEL